MSLLRTLQYGSSQIRSEMTGTPAPWDDFWYQPIGTRSSTGIRVSPESAKTNATVLSCVNKISKTLAMLPLKVYTDTPGGGKQIAKNAPIYDVLYSRPNSQQTAFEWRQMMQGHLELRGNAYSEIRPGPRGAVDQLVPMHPDRVYPELLQTGRIRYRYNDPLTGTDRFLAQEQVFHLRNFMDNGIVGQSTVAMGTETIGLALAAQDNFARFLKNDSRTQFVIKGSSFKTKQDQANFRQMWQEAHTGANRYKVAVLPTGMDIASIGVSARDAELLEARKLSREEICSMFDVPPHIVGVVEKTASYASVEQFNIFFATFCIMPRLVLWEQAIQRALIFNSAYFAKFSMGALLRGDTAARYGAYKLGIENGWLSQNDVRIAEDMNPIEDGDNYWRPMNWARLGDVHVSVQPKSPDNELEQDQTTQSTTAKVDERFYLLAVAGAERCVRKEMGAVRRMIEQGASREDVSDFYRDHADFVAGVFKLPREKTQAYCARRAALYDSLPDADTSIRELAALALGGIQ